MNNQSVGQRIRLRRGELGLQQADLAASIGASRVTISQWETGIKKVGPRSLFSLAMTLGVTQQWLKTGEEPKLRELVDYLPAPEEFPGVVGLMAAEDGQPYRADPPLDQAVLGLAIETLEIFLAHHRRKLDPKAKAQAVVSLYTAMRLWRPEALTAANVTPLVQALLAG